MDDLFSEGRESATRTCKYAFARSSALMIEGSYTVHKFPRTDLEKIQNDISSPSEHIKCVTCLAPPTNSPSPWDSGQGFFILITVQLCRALPMQSPHLFTEI